MEGLNDGQRRAVTHGAGPQLVIAGAGTGKTTVVTRRIAWLINEKKVAPSAILALTFTDKAAGEMEQRVDKLVPYGYVDTWISTFHAFGDRILREHSLEAGLSPNYGVLSQSEQAVFLRERIFSLQIDEMRPLNTPNKFITSIVEHISRLKDELVTPEEYINFCEKYASHAKSDEEQKLAKKYLELATIYANYEVWMQESDQVDFGGQIFKAVELLRNNPDILKKYQKQFQYCLVDEFQDTNTAQNELVKLLFGEKALHQNITVVGDDDQSIYGFRGAVVQNILDFQKNWKGCKTVVLNKNYRSKQAILDCAYELIKQNNPDRLETIAKINKKLIGINAGRKPEFTIFDEDYSESKFIIDNIKKEVEDGRKYNEIAVLARANNHLDPLIYRLRCEGIPFIAPGSSGLYDEPIIKLLISFAKVIANYEDHLSLYYLATSRAYNIDTRTMTIISSYTRHRNKHFRHTLENIGSTLELKEKFGDDLDSIKKLVNDINHFTEFARDHNIGEVIYKWLNETKLLKNIIKASEKDILAQIELENIAAFYEKIKDFVRSSHNSNTTNFVDNIKLLMEAGENPASSQDEIDVNAVTLLTVHSAKGLEWPVVFLPSLSADRFPSRHRTEALPLPDDLIKNKFDKDQQTREERRLFYVALTRAKEKVFLSVAKKYDNGVREKKISPFVFETLGEDVKQAPQTKINKIEKLQLFDTDNRSLVEPAIKKFFKTDRISLTPHQIDDYITCPKKFEYIHIIEVPITTNWQVSYGNILHNVIAYYFTAKIKGETPPLEELLQLYSGGWKSEGFVSFEQEKRKKQVGQQALIDFYEREEKEQRDIRSVEQPFEFRIGEIKIRGRFDCVINKIDKKIIDFKTSDVVEDEKAEKRVKDSTQLQMYAMAEEKISGKRPKTALYFIESGIIYEHIFTDKELGKTKDKIMKVVDGLKKQDFKATPGYNQCRWCAYKDICPYKAKGA